jgi:hypothetical protein
MIGFPSWNFLEAGVYSFWIISDELYPKEKERRRPG